MVQRFIEVCIQVLKEPSKMHSAMGIEAFDRTQLQGKEPSQHDLPTTLHALVRLPKWPFNQQKQEPTTLRKTKLRDF